MNDTIEICKTNAVDPEKVNLVKEKLPNSQNINNLSETFKTLGDPTRLQIILARSFEELCVCNLAAVVNMSISAISRQLRILKGMKIVSFRNAGKIKDVSLHTMTEEGTKANDTFLCDIIRVDFHKK